MANYRALSRQVDPILANIYHGQVQHVAYLTVLLIAVAYPCVLYLRTLMWPVMISKVDTGRANLSQWEMHQ
jgi:hypothetical protein